MIKDEVVRKIMVLANGSMRNKGKTSEADEVYVTFETAKLLKEAGFPQWDNEHIYDLEGCRTTYECYPRQSLMEIHRQTVTAPTQTSAMRWLREKKG